MKDVSIIIITSKRIQLLKNLLHQIKESFKESEVIIVVNNDEPKEYQHLKEQFPFHWLIGNYKTPGTARNAGIKASYGKWVLFLDDDVELPENFHQQAQIIFNELAHNVVVIGGPDQSPPKASYFSQALNLALSSPMATAHTRLRHSSNVSSVRSGDETNLILCNLWVKKEFIKNHAIEFNEHLFRNEENLFITQVLGPNGTIMYHPELFVYHYRKTQVNQLFRAVFSSGLHRIKSTLFSRDLFSALFLVPALLVLYLLGLPLLSEVPYGLVPLKVYLTLSLVISLKIGSGLYWPLVLFYQIFINIAYGFGIIVGLLLLPLWAWRIRG